MSTYDELLKKLPDSFYSRDEDSDIAKLLKLYCDNCDELRQKAVEISLLRDISSQNGALLDRIGEILKMERENRNDDDYRLLLMIAIQRNISNGSLKTLGDIIRLVCGDADFNIVELYTSDTSNFLDNSGYFDSTGFFSPSSGKIPGSVDVIFPGDTSGLNLELLSIVLDRIKSAGIKTSIKSN